MNFDRTIPAQKFLNLTSNVDADGFLNLFSGPDEAAEVEKIYQQAIFEFPIDSKVSSCDQLSTQSRNIQLIIDASIQKKTQDDSKGNQRVQNRYIDAYTKRKNDIVAVYNQKNCEAILEEAEEKDFFEDQYSNLEKVKGLTDKTGNTTKYLIFGMLGIVVVISGIIIFKKN